MYDYVYTMYDVKVKSESVAETLIVTKFLK